MTVHRYEPIETNAATASASRPQVELSPDDAPRDACGVFAIRAPGVDVARIAFFALYALQHRGQESGGIATCDGTDVHLHRGMGRVHQIFDEARLRPLVGHLAIGHNRYSTSGSSDLRHAQPYAIETADGPVAIAHNGNLTNQTALRERLRARGVRLASDSDSELFLHLLAAEVSTAPASPWEERLRRVMAQAQGAYSLVVLTRDAVFGVRDPLAMRPLAIGRVPTGPGPHEAEAGYAIASESCAFEAIGGELVREVEPAEIVRIDATGLRAFAGEAAPSRALCVFEYVYLARPDSFLDGVSVHDVRQRTGAQLWREAPADADVIVGVPDSAIAAAIGFSAASGIPYNEGLMKNHYVGRTFIEPTDRLRKLGVSLKFNPLRANLENRRVVLVDDSIVRGNTAGPIIALLRAGGAREVHVRVASPVVRHPCFMGVDLATYGELIGAARDIEGIRQHIGADSLAYLSLDGLLSAVSAGALRHCHACFSGRYPLDVSSELEQA